MAALEKAFPLLPSIVRFTRSYVVDELLGVGILRCWKVDIMGVGYVMDDSAAL